MKHRPPRLRGGLHTARTLALQALIDCRQPAPRRAFVQDVLDRLLGQVTLSSADRRLTTQLVYGTLRRRGTLQALVLPLIARSAHKVEPWLQDALSLGAYQLVFLTHVPPHAALNETVELANQFGRPSAKGFLNGVLRSLAELLTDVHVEAPAVDALPLTDGVYRRLRRPMLPDPTTQTIAYLADGFSLPMWLADRWLRRLGWDECVRLGFWFAAPASLTLRCNPLRTSRPALLAALIAGGVSADPGEHPQAIRLREGAPIRDLPGYADGWFTVQDESAMAVACALAPEPGWRVLDLCAAPGGKATHLAELLGDRGEVLACDIDPRRLETVSALARRLGLQSLRVCRIDADDPTSLLAGPFDAALVDAPCSNTGVLGRRPEVRWRLKPRDLRELPQLQARLLDLAAQRIRPGGVLVYSTCSIEPEENQRVIGQFLQTFPSWQLEGELTQLPGQPADGGYWARLRKQI